MPTWLGWTLVLVGAGTAFAVQVLLVRHNPGVAVRGAPLRVQRDQTWPERLLLIVPASVWLLGALSLTQHGRPFRWYVLALGLLFLSWLPRLVHNVRLRRGGTQSGRPMTPTPAAAVGPALEVARVGLAAGELPIGAAVLLGDEIVATAHTQEAAQGRRLVHAELLALVAADTRLGWAPRRAPLTLATTLEPCLMCCGAAMSMQVERFVFGLRSPSDGATAVAATRTPHPDAPFLSTPEVVGDVAVSEVRTLFAQYVDRAPASGLRDWAESLACDGGPAPTG